MQDKIRPHLLERRGQIWPYFPARCDERGKVGAVGRGRDAVLEFPAFAAIGAVGFGEPVAGADERRFGDDVEGCLLRACR